MAAPEILYQQQMVILSSAIQPKLARKFLGSIYSLDPQSPEFKGVLRSGVRAVDLIPGASTEFISVRSELSRLQVELDLLLRHHDSEIPDNQYVFNLFGYDRKALKELMDIDDTPELTDESSIELYESATGNMHPSKYLMNGPEIYAIVSNPVQQARFESLIKAIEGMANHKYQLAYMKGKVACYKPQQGGKGKLLAYMPMERIFTNSAEIEHFDIDDAAMVMGATEDLRDSLLYLVKGEIRNLYVI